MVLKDLFTGGMTALLWLDTGAGVLVAIGVGVGVLVAIGVGVGAIDSRQTRLG